MDSESGQQTSTPSGRRGRRSGSCVHHDALVLGGTPAGIAAAVRMAREGLSVSLVAHNEHLGGMMASGLSQTDDITKKQRGGILEEFLDGVRKHYRETYGPNSEQFNACLNGYRFEPHIAEDIFNELTNRETSLTVYRNHQLVSVDRTADRICAVTVASSEGNKEHHLSADAFVDATYEGDLAAEAGVPYRIGRESRSEHGEQFAGRVFTNKLSRMTDSVGGTKIFPGSTGEGDDAIQAYDYRVCICRDPENRRLPEQPESYDREEYLDMFRDESVVGSSPLKSELIDRSVEEIREMGVSNWLFWTEIPNRKADLNSADLPGANHEYPEGDRETRERIAQSHREHALGLLYFLQNDKSVPDFIQEEMGQWGLPRDEFEDNDNFPWQLYVREARRIQGRYTFTEQDATHARGLNRTPIHSDAIAIAEFGMDSHDCRQERKPGSLADGHVYLGEITQPSQIPFRSLIPETVNNLLVPVAVSATHIGFGTIRMEPTWMQTGEAAGLSIVLTRDSKVDPADVDIVRLQRELLDQGNMLTFFEEFDMGTDEQWVSAMQFFGTKGFFRSYDARPAEPLDEATAKQWVEVAVSLVAGNPVTSTKQARSLPTKEGEPISWSLFTDFIAAAINDRDLNIDFQTVLDRDINGGDSITRGFACSVLYDIVG